MTRHSLSEPPPKLRHGRSIGEGEPAVVRPADQPSFADEFWRRQMDPHRPENHRFADRLHARLMENLGDENFLVSMGNRLRMLERERRAPAALRRLKRFLFGTAEINEITGLEIKRLKALAGETPPDSLPDLRRFDIPYDEFERLVTAAERHAGQTDIADPEPDRAR